MYSSGELDDDASDEDSLNGLEADFEALLGQGLGALSASSALGSALGGLGVDMAQWRLALAPRDVLV